MAGSGAIFVGKMFEALPVTLLVFAVAYTTTKKKWAISIPKSRAVALFFCTFMVTGLMYGIFYDGINSGFGTTVDPGLKGIFTIPAQFCLAAIVSLVVIHGLGRPRATRE